jgi:probable addiction module antidote protein
MKTASVFDIAEYLDSKEMIQGFLEDCFEADDPAVFKAAIKYVIRAIKMHNLSEVHIDEARIETSLQPDKQPDIETMHYIMKVLGLHISSVSHTTVPAASP